MSGLEIRKASGPNFVTLFDKQYASRALALLRSLQRHLGEFTLWVIAMDDYVEELFGRLDLQHVEVIPLKSFETDQLLKLRESRTKAEYAWTLTPFVFDEVFSKLSINQTVTYLDADLWFLQSPLRLIKEFDESQFHVLITEHAYHPSFDASLTSGKFCVQFLSMKPQGTKPIRLRWQQQCVDWCFAFPDRGRYGDQGYLNEWPDRYPAAVFVPPREYFQGPWNSLRFPFGEAISFHFHNFLYFGQGRFSIGPYPISRPHKKFVYASYVRDLRWSEEMILATGLGLNGHAKWWSWPPTSLRRIVRKARLIISS